MIKNLRAQIVVVIMLCVLIVFSLIFTMIFIVSKNNLEEELRSEMLSSAYAPANVPFYNELIIRVNLENQIATIEGNYDSFTKEQIESMIASCTSSEGIYKFDQMTLYYVRTVSTNGLTYVFAEAAIVTQALKSVILSFIPVSILGLLICFIMALIASKLLTKPIEKAWNREHSFFSDASHELKTPLSVILANAQMLETEELDEKTQRRLLHHLTDEAAMMKTLIQEMLDLTRNTSKQVQEPVNLSSLIEDQLLSFEALFFENGHLIESEILPDQVLPGIEEQLIQLVRILLDNADKYAVGEMIFVKLYSSANRLRFEVLSPGDEILGDDKEKIFDRFYRMDSSRSSQGYGLGLSLAKKIAESHKAKIYYQRKDDLNAFVVEFSHFGTKKTEAEASV